MAEYNRAFAEMGKVARSWLAGRDPHALAKLAGVDFDPERMEFILRSLGREVRISWPECAIEGIEGDWYALLLLHYLHLADGAPLSGRQIAFSELRDGMVRGGGFDRDSAARLSRMLGDRAPEEVERAFAALGAEIVDSNADLCAVFPLFPRWPMTLKLWFADDELPASAKLLLNASADHYLSVEDAVTAGEVLIQELEAQFSK